MFSFLLAAVLAALPAATGREVSECSCGFLDQNTLSVYTDSLVVYFNETEAIDPNIFEIQQFAHKKEHGWNSQFKIGAAPANVRLSNITDHGTQVQALELLLDPPDKEHLVNGGSLQSSRKDIQYGLFEAAMRPAGIGSTGTTLSFGVNYNRSNGAQIDFMNSNGPNSAQVSNLMNGEWPATNLVTNYTTLQEAGLQPWRSFNKVQFSWNESAVAFNIAENTTRIATKKERSMPSAGQALKINTWSIGDKTYGRGPPTHNSTRSHVLWVRAFFNSTEMTKSQHASFDERCLMIAPCLTQDTTLRGYTAYGPSTLVKWKEPPKHQGIRELAGIVAACCSSFGILALSNVFLRRAPWKKLWAKKAQVVEIQDSQSIDTGSCKDSKAESVSETSTNIPTGVETPLPAYWASTPRSGSHTPAPSYHTNAATPSLRHAGSMASLVAGEPSKQGCTPGGSQADLRRVTLSPQGDNSNRLQKALNRISEMSNFEKSVTEDLKSIPTFEGTIEDADEISPVHAPAKEISVEKSSPAAAGIVVTEKGKQAISSVQPVSEEVKPTAQVITLTATPLLSPTKRVDYLAGLTAVACIAVTIHHFGQTFWPFAIEGHGPTAHYPSVEKWVHFFVGNIILTNLWIGPFFLTATRFLSTNYLKHGKLEDIAKKELRRAPRLFVPIVVVSLLQYFLISMGLTSSLQWLPSVSFSTWPYVQPQRNFAVYMNNIVELAYKIPNAVPEVTSHYCIGVLWTVPVQLQFTYVVLAATVVIRDIRNPWKRTGIYTAVILAGWYARSWSACHWAGLALSDLEATYQWRKRLRTRPFARYAILTGASACALGATLFGAFNQTYSVTTAENSIHPSPSTGAPISSTKSVYPNYQEPTLAILLFSIGLQIIVEHSTWVQAFLSLRIFVHLNPQTFCIYLTHGFIMWTWGAWVAVLCNDAGLPYWANLLVTFTTTFFWIFALAWILTPLLEFPTQALMRNIDRWTKEEPRPKRPTAAPFSKGLVLNRGGGGVVPGQA